MTKSGPAKLELKLGLILVGKNQPIYLGNWFAALTVMEKLNMDEEVELTALI